MRVFVLILLLLAALGMYPFDLTLAFICIGCLAWSNS